MTNAPTRAGRVLCAAVMTACLSAAGLLAQAAPPDFDTLEGWIQEYGYHDPADHEGARRAEEIFERLVQVANDPDGRSLELAVVGTRKPYGKPTAAALPDDSVVVTEEMLDLCFDGKSNPLPGRDKKRDRGETRLALLLAHEIAHFTLHHLDHQKSAQPFAGRTAVVDKTIERTADHQALRLMMQAGFNPDHLFENSHRFFAEWQEALLNEQPELNEREIQVENRLQEVYRQVPYFQWGTRLLQLGRYQDGLDLLEPFHDKLASPEVLSNLGFAYFQMAATHLAACDGRLVERFMLPTRIDPRTLADRSRRRGTGARSPCFENSSYEENRDRALRYLKSAVARDPAYLPARLNLAALHLLDENGYNAMTAAGELRVLAPEAPETTNALALAEYLIDLERGRSQAADEALEALEAAYLQHPEATFLLFNQARINQERQRGATARKRWDQFLRAEPSGTWAALAREGLGETVAFEPPAHVEPPVASPFLKRNKIKGCERQQIEGAGTLRGHFYANTEQELYALEIKDVIEVVERRWVLSPQTLDELRQLHALGEPAHRLPLHRGELLVWPGGYAAEVEEDGSVWAEIWYVP